MAQRADRTDRVDHKALITLETLYRSIATLIGVSQRAGIHDK